MAAKLTVPENSLEGFRLTLELGLDGIEFDVHPTRDGGLAVIHDPTLDRTTDGVGRLRRGAWPSCRPSACTARMRACRR